MASMPTRCWIVRQSSMTLAIYGECVVKSRHRIFVAALVAIGAPTSAAAQQPAAPAPPPVIPYGTPMNLEAAKKAMAASEAKAGAAAVGQ